VKSGAITQIQVGLRAVRIDPASVDAHIAGHRMKTRPPVEEAA
jgi:hypothetical protein